MRRTYSEIQSAATERQDLKTKKHKDLQYRINKFFRTICKRADPGQIESQTVVLNPDALTGEGVVYAFDIGLYLPVDLQQSVMHPPDRSRTSGIEGGVGNLSVPVDMEIGHR